MFVPSKFFLTQNFKIMKTINKILLAIIGIVLINACDEPVDDSPTLTPDGGALLEKIKNHRVAKTQNFSVLLTSAGATIEGEEGTVVNFKYNSVEDGVGNSMMGETIDVEMIEIYSKSDMLLLNKSTMGVLPLGGNHATLISGGEVYLKAYKDGEELYVTDNSIIVKYPVDNMGGYDSEMSLFEDFCCDNDCDGVFACPDDDWEQADSAVLILDNAAGIGYYSGVVDNFGWTNVDKFATYAAPKTLLKARAPEEFNATNCAVYISFDGEPNALGSLDEFLTDEGVFSEHYGQIPVGLDVHLIAISMVDDAYYYSITSATIVEDAVIALEELTETTEADLVSAINSLP